MEERVRIDTFIIVIKIHIFHDQAGLVIYTKPFNSFAWEEESKILGLPYFYLGINLFLCLLLYIKSIFNFVYYLSIYFACHWKWNITHCVYQ